MLLPPLIGGPIGYNPHLETKNPATENAMPVPKNQDDLMSLEGGSSIQEMALRLTQMKLKLDLVQQFFREVMKKDVDYGVIPGTQKPSLHKPGAEKLCELYGYAIIIAKTDVERDLQTGFYRAEITIRLVHKKTGQIVAEGIGEANVYESKYRYRLVHEWDLPKGVDKDSLVSKEFRSESGAVYKKYRVENTDLFDLWNSVLKIAKKRALVDAALSATRSSGIFSQDDDALDTWIGGAEEVPAQGDQGKKPEKQSEEQKKQNTDTSKNAVATDRQLKKLFAMSKELGLEQDTIKAMMQERYGKGASKDLTKQEASDFIKYLEKLAAGEEVWVPGEAKV